MNPQEVTRVAASTEAEATEAEAGAETMVAAGAAVTRAESTAARGAGGAVQRAGRCSW